MRLIGIATTWNEADIADAVFRHMAEECDIVLVADASTDGTLGIMERIPRLEVVPCGRETFPQHRIMNELAWRAEWMGADWIIPFDADEWWYSPSGSLRDALTTLDEPATSVGAYTFVPQPTDDLGEHNPFRRCRWRWPAVLPGLKVAFMPGPDRILATGNHSVSDVVALPGPLCIRHLPYRSLEQAKAKMRHGKAILDMTGAPATEGTHWRQFGAMTDAEFETWWANYTDPINPSLPGSWAVPGPLVEDPL